MFINEPSFLNPVSVQVWGFFVFDYGQIQRTHPAQMQKALMDFERYMDNKFVTKDSHDISINEMKADIEEIKQKLDKIYDMLIKA